MLRKKHSECLCEALNRGEKASILGNSILIRSSNWLGDAIMSMPAVAKILEQSKGKADVSILAPEKLREVWKLLPGIKEILPAKKCLYPTAKLVKSRKFTSAILFPNSLRSALEVFLGGVPARAGYAGHGRRFLLTAVFEKEKKEEVYHQKLDYLNLAREFGFDVQEDAGLPQVNKPQNKLREKEYLAVCPGAEYGPAKRWPAERFGEAAQKIAARHNLEIILLGAKADRKQANDVEKKIGAEAVNLAGKTSLSEFISYLAHAKLVFCNDSGAMHAAALLRTKAVAIFGSTEPELTGPLSDSVKVVREKVSCAPCFLRECRTYFECMKKISVEAVVEAAEEILRK